MARTSADNYSAWTIDPADFPHARSDGEKLAFFVRYAILAPSGHTDHLWVDSAS